MVIDIVVTRHRALLSYLSSINMTTKDTVVISHASPADITGKDVAGVLPHSLSCLTNSFTEIPLNIPFEMRGKELSLEDIRKYAGDAVTYKIKRCER